MKRLQRTMFLTVIYFACISFSSCLTFTAQWCSKPEARRRRLELLLKGGGCKKKYIKEYSFAIT